MNFSELHDTISNQKQRHSGVQQVTHSSGSNTQPSLSCDLLAKPDVVGGKGGNTGLAEGPFVLRGSYTHTHTHTE